MLVLSKVEMKFAMKLDKTVTVEAFDKKQLEMTAKILENKWQFSTSQKY